MIHSITQRPLLDWVCCSSRNYSSSICSSNALWSCLSNRSIGQIDVCSWQNWNKEKVISSTNVKANSWDWASCQDEFILCGPYRHQLENIVLGNWIFFFYKLGYIKLQHIKHCVFYKTCLNKTYLVWYYETQIVQFNLSVQIYPCIY